MAHGRFMSTSPTFASQIANVLKQSRTSTLANWLMDDGETTQDVVELDVGETVDSWRNQMKNSYIFWFQSISKQKLGKEIHPVKLTLWPISGIRWATRETLLLERRRPREMVCSMTFSVWWIRMLAKPTLLYPHLLSPCCSLQLSSEAR